MTASIQPHRLGQPVPTNWLDHLGWFRFDFADEQWTWSPELERMHGYPPDSTAPSTRLLLSHVHPRDQERVVAILRDVRRTRQPFSSRHRIIDIHGHVHDVVMTGAPVLDVRGTPVGMQGMCVDLSEAAAPASHRRYEHTTNQLRLLCAGKSYPKERRQRIRAATRC
jgi:PAS domain S-box-containing protein